MEHEKAEKVLVFLAEKSHVNRYWRMKSNGNLKPDAPRWKTRNKLERELGPNSKGHMGQFRWFGFPPVGKILTWWVTVVLQRGLAQMQKGGHVTLFTCLHLETPLFYVIQNIPSLLSVDWLIERIKSTILLLLWLIKINKFY